VRATQHKGDVATAQALSTFTASGYDVSIPLTESAAYDLIVDAGGELHRVQCKFSSTREVDLRRIHSNSNGYVEKRVTLNAYDWLYVLRPDGSQFLIKECHAGRRAVTPRPEHRLELVTGSALLDGPSAPLPNTG
jgi:PD-(D/E)XK endonuclease